MVNCIWNQKLKNLYIYKLFILFKKSEFDRVAWLEKDD